MKCLDCSDNFFENSMRLFREEIADKKEWFVINYSLMNNKNNEIAISYKRMISLYEDILKVIIKHEEFPDG